MNEEWQNDAEVLNLQEMDALIGELRDAKTDYDKAKKEASLAKQHYDNLQLKVSAALESANKDKYVCDHGTVSIVRKLAVRVPATPEDRLKFFKWLEENEGQEVADNYKTVNSQALNTLYNQLAEEYAARGEVLEIEGLEAPTYRETLSFRK